ncbi:geranylgeranyl transferase type 2 subunit alpha [Delitschia confertaspora ATCC 74209]|uniref:Geranylgeranyl transferase type-2 subunit alpha n=1 Tax=Delitschia confertaspora ATCC 74209 TaxID=1513339 RepID=A0A9P4JJY4_9PLEO|nr:geranylgeranyl transferase type 2 subunit alpha [Delitschia confertaspora ATCC 74209]
MASHGIARSAGSGVRSEAARRIELQQIETYKDLVGLVNTKVAERQYTVEVLALTTKLLTENPEYYTIWNHRRRILQKLLSDTAPDEPKFTSDQFIEQLITDDLQLTYKLLRGFPKCYWIWNHRNWILRNGEALLDAPTSRKLWLGELQLVSKMLQADNRNFHAWGYRRFVVAELQRLTQADEVPPEGPSLTESEFEYTTKMVNTNLSNFSAWHNRSKLIPRLLDERKADDTARRKLFDDELSLVCSAINTDPFDQSIWYYHQFLMSTLSPDCPRQSQIVLSHSNQDRGSYYEHEMEYIRDILEDETDCKWIYEALLTIACSYLEVSVGTNPFTTSDMHDWLEALQRLDPLRKGRWDDWRRSLNL